MAETGESLTPTDLNLQLATLFVASVMAFFIRRALYRR
jgi:hypothetical protein